METLPSLDAHAHLEPVRHASLFPTLGCVVAPTTSLPEAQGVITRRDPNIAWGVGCHPNEVESQHGFDPDLYATLLKDSAIAGEIGLDTHSAIPLHEQQRTLRTILGIVAKLPRIVTIHSNNATSLILEELRATPVQIPVLHMWTGTEDETRQAVEIGCYFSVHESVAADRKFGNAVPTSRILIETDAYGDNPREEIPSIIASVEQVLAGQYGIDATEMRRIAWQNFARIVRETAVQPLLPPRFTEILSSIS